MNQPLRIVEAAPDDAASIDSRCPAGRELQELRDEVARLAAALRRATEGGLAAGPELVSAAELAKLLDLPKRTIWTFASEGKLPRSIKLSARAVRWRRREIDAWVAAGCPDQATWERLRIGAGGQAANGRR